MHIWTKIQDEIPHPHPLPPPTPSVGAWCGEDEVAVSENFLVFQTRQQFGRREVDTTQSWQLWAPTYTRHCPLIKQFNSSLPCLCILWVPTYTRHCPLIKQFNSPLTCPVLCVLWAPTYTRHCPLIKQFNSPLSCSVCTVGSWTYTRHCPLIKQFELFMHLWFIRPHA
jgi:hypothetical protein